MGPISFLNNGSTTIGSKMKPVFWYPQFCTGWYPQVMSWLDVSFQGSIEYSCGGKGVGGFSIAMLQLRPEIPVISQWNHPIYAIIHKPIGTKRHRNACVQKKLIDKGKLRRNGLQLLVMFITWRSHGTPKSKSCETMTFCEWKPWSLVGTPFQEISNYIYIYTYIYTLYWANGWEHILFYNG